MLYHWYELSHAAVRPARAAAGNTQAFFENPFNPLAHTSMGRHAAAACEVFERTTRRYGRPSFGIESTRVDGERVPVCEEVVWQRPFCRLVRFRRGIDSERAGRDPRILIVAPMSGHYATLLRGTVERFLPDHDVYITDWQDARTIPLAAGRFDLDSYIDYMIEMLHHFGGDVHVFAVCQPAVPVMAAISLMEEDGDPCVPATLTLAGGPLDTRINPTAVNELAEEKSIDWFAHNVIEVVPWTNLGYGRAVYPGFLQLTGFMTMNLDRHMTAHKDLFLHLVHGDCDSAGKHRAFYDEYLSVMDLTAEFYLQTIDTVFIRHDLPKGVMMHRGRRVDTSAICRIPIMTIEGEHDDITGLGQCRAAHAMTPSLPNHLKSHYEVKGVGHYGIFNGSKFRNEIAPRITQFVRAYDSRAALIAEMPVYAEAVAKPAAHGSDCEISDVAFTFSPANDASPDPMSARLKAHGLPAGSHDAYSAANNEAGQEDESMSSAMLLAPFRMWALASQMMIEGVFGPRRNSGV
ncbi:MAG: polyhydroxyalkanoate depolymerase [Alphaproteobacteria bacterium]|nr:polyhydroxyalkanoate depolymerase [Alphaproteobacteria bacterium]